MTYWAVDSLVLCLEVSRHAGGRSRAIKGSWVCRIENRLGSIPISVFQWDDSEQSYSPIKNTARAVVPGFIRV